MVAEMRRVLRAMLPAGAFLKRDRDATLFVTDAPRRGPCPDFGAADFESSVEGGLARLTPGARWLHALEAEYPEPPDGLCAGLARFRGEPDRVALALFAEGLKQLDGAPRDPAYERRLRQLAAVTLREHSARGGLYACGLVNYLIEKERAT